MIKPEIHIVLAQPEDVRGMQEVFYKTWLETYPNAEVGITREDIEDRFKEAFSDEILGKRAEGIRNPPPGNTLFFAKDGNKVVGLARIIESEKENRLQAIYVLPEYQGEGIGKMLWQKACEVFNPSKDILVALAVYNKKALGFYESLGFVDTGKRWGDEKFRMKSGALIPEMELIIRRAIK